jgi:hypothetical protein
MIDHQVAARMLAFRIPSHHITIAPIRAAAAATTSQPAVIHA